MNKAYNLFLDDIRTPEAAFEYTLNPLYNSENWEIVRSYDQFVKFVTENGLPSMVSFDHDLADAHYHESMYQDGKVYMKYLETTSEKTGHDCVKWLVEYCMDKKAEFPMWYIHSMNPVGTANMKGYILSYLKTVNASGLAEVIDTQPEEECPCGGKCKCQD